MNTKLVIILVVLAVAGVGSYYFMGTRNPAMSPMQNGMMGADTYPSGGFASMIESGEPLECDYSYETSTDAGRGTFYIDEDARNFRFDLELTRSPAGPMTTHVVGSQGFIYSWRGGDSQGMKMQMAGSPKDSMLSSTGAGFMDQNMDMDCQSWRVDSSKLMPPSNVSFMEARAAY